MEDDDDDGGKGAQDLDVVELGGGLHSASPGTQVPASDDARSAGWVWGGAPDSLKILDSGRVFNGGDSLGGRWRQG
jgi:hypothetical protein